MCYHFSRQHEAAERNAMRRWLRSQGIKPVARGKGLNDTQKLMVQVLRTGGDVGKLMAEGRAKVDARRKEVEHGQKG